MDRIKTAVFVAGAFVMMHATGLPAARRTDAPPPASQYQNQTPGDFRPRVNDRQVQQILTRIRTDAETLRGAVGTSPPYGRAYGRARRDDDVSYLIDDLVQAADHLADHVDRRVVLRVDVEDVLRHGAAIQDALTQQRLAQQRWPALRRDLDNLASAYGLSWNWQNPQYGPVGSGGNLYQRLTGTYALDTARSDDPRRAADQALRRLSAGDRARALQQIEARLDPPEAIAIDRENNRVTIASSRAPQVSFDVDGRPRSEQGPRGGTMSTRASVYGDRLEVAVTGSGGTDFTAIFEPLDNGQSLRVTRRMVIDAANQPVEVRSVYRRTSDTPDWNVYNSSRSRPGYDRPPSGRQGYQSVLIPDNTRVTATLDRALNVGNARQDDRITLTVRNAPRADLEGATIQGYVSTAPSRTANRTQLTVDFDQIQLRNGQSGNFSGVIESVRGPDGRPISFNGETVSNDQSNQTQQAIQRGAIGAAVGALIGAIAAGGKGAAVGAVIGGGGAAATVFIDDAGQRDLPAGTEFTIRSRSYAPRP